MVASLHNSPSDVLAELGGELLARAIAPTISKFMPESEAVPLLDDQAGREV